MTITIGKAIATAMVAAMAAVTMRAGDPAHMLSLPCLGADPERVDWLDSRIPRLPGREVVVFRGEEKVSAYNNHAYIARYQGRFWVMWSSHPTDGNYHGMHVRYSTSADGETWSAAGLITPVPEHQRFVARGFWVREGRLLALASLDSNTPALSRKTGYWPAEDIELRAFEWNERRGEWQPAGRVYDDTISNYPPWRLPGGEWILARRDHRDEVSFLIGGVESTADWSEHSIPNPEKRRFNEPDFLVRPDGTLAAHLRDNSGSKRIYRSTSADGGRTWTTPVRTDFPDATSKNFNLRLSGGEYILLNNPNPKRRVPLALSVSRDGVVYDRMGIVSEDAAEPRIPGHDKGVGYTYPHAMEHEGHLYVACAKRRDDIVVRKIAVKDVVGMKGVCMAERSFPDLVESMRNFQEGRVLIAALELDVFTAVGQGADAPQVAARLQADPRATEMFLNALAAIGALAKEDGVFRNTGETARFLVAGSPENQRPALMHTVNVWRAWTTLADCVRAGTAVQTPGVEGGNREWTDSFIAAMHRGAQASAPEMVRVVGVEGVRRLLDVGGGSGAYSIAFAQAKPDLHAEILDIASVAPIAQRHIQEAGLAGRVTTRVGDLLRDDFGRDYDLVLLSAICHMLSPAENQDLVKRCARALVKGGRVVVRDFILEPGKTAPRQAALFALNMLVATRGGSTYTEREYSDWLEAAGLENVTRPAPGGDLIVASKR